MGYYIDLESISLDKYGEKMKTAYFPPSRMMLKENIPERFGQFKNMGIKNVHELRQFLRKKEDHKEISKTTGLSPEYLTILLRELNSILPKPNRIRDFRGISDDTVVKLEKKGITNTFKLFDKVKDRKGRRELSKSTDIDDQELLELTRLCDLSRIRWVGATFAYMLVNIGVDTVEKASKADPEELHKEINRINKEKSFYKGQIGLNDMKIFVDTAKEVPLEIEY